ncbi:Fcf1-domain-containing protein [Tribonema minus]|uniref:Fcf1-domain-containing protein n=1 Tax=Tribonema minus TaxID=303371 RepID=A0A836CF02_9STRA|nr:Fcf1-domain-containing protein [Tribonema minus]
MGRAKKQRAVKVKFAQSKRLISPKDPRLKEVAKKAEEKAAKAKEKETRQVTQTPSAMFFKYNTALGPPYHVIVDTNFINFSIKNKLDMVKSMMDCLLAKATPCITDCVIAELEKLGPKYRIALRLAKDERFQRLPCSHKGTYADDCILQRAEQHRCYIVATCDKELKRRIRKIAGVPIMYISNRKYTIERMPEAFGAPPS